jgi:hypothetical protein
MGTGRANRKLIASGSSLWPYLHVKTTGLGDSGPFPLPRQCKIVGMTENLEKPMPREESADETPSVLPQPPVDFVLQAIVQLANDTGIELGLTVCVGGIVVSGTLIPGKKYFEEIANDALQASGPADQAVIRQAISDYLGNFGKMIYEQPENEEQSGNNGDETMKKLPGYIHLRGAKFFHNSGNPIPTNQGLRWRGRLSKVDGFSLGAMFAS